MMTEYLDCSLASLLHLVCPYGRVVHVGGQMYVGDKKTDGMEVLLASHASVFLRV